MIDQILGHYHVIEMIGAGGMGEVYRAYDKQLDRYVALKVLPPGFLADEAARRRFRTEALALAKLNHPNIETVYEFGTHDGVDFLAMELITGQSLSQRVKDGSLSQPEIIRLAIQLADGLTAAHVQGVIHRDLKPANLMVTPDGWLKILDFGLAKLIHPELDTDLTRSIEQGGVVSGTLPYMSPEQLRGMPVDARCDIYSAGAVLYEMATGQRPFVQQQALHLISAILQDQPLSPSSINPSMSPGLQAVIAKALVKEPSQRYQTARELRVALEGITMGLTSAGLSVAPKSPKSFKWLPAMSVLIIMTAGAAIVLNLGGIRARLFHEPSVTNESGSRSASIKLRPAVAVLGFKNLSGRPDEAWLSTALAEMLTTEVSAGEKLRVIPGENVAKMKIDLSLPDADSYGHGTLQQIRRNIGSDYVVMGSYLALGNGQVRLDLRLEDANSGELLSSVSNRGNESQLDDLVSQAGAKLRTELGAGDVTTREASQLKASRPSNPEAARLYAEGLAKLRKFDNLGGRDLLEKAIAADPNFANAHSALASVLAEQGYAGQAKEEAQKALTLSASLSREDRMAIEARFYTTDSQYDKAAEIYRSLWKFYPDNISYGLQLASALNNAGKPNDSLAVIEVMRTLPPPANDNPFIDMREAVTAGSLGDFKREQAAAAIAVEKGKKLGARLLTANALYTEGWAWSELGDTQKAMEAAEQSRDLYAAIGDPAAGSKSLTLIGGLLTDKGDLEGALQAYALYYQLEREKGSIEGIGFAQNDIATVMVIRGDLAQAAKSLSESRNAFREVRDQDSEAYALNNLSPVLLEQGNLNGADKADDESLAIFRQVDDKDGIAYALINRGNILDARGDLEGAKKSYIEIQLSSVEISDQNISAHALDGLAAVAAETGDLDLARRQFLAAIALWDKLGIKLSSAESRLALADVSLNKGNSAEAQTSARQAIQEFHAENATDDIILGHTVLARSLFAEGKLEEAGKEISDVAKIAAKTQNAGVRLQYDITASRIRAQRGHRSQAEATLNLVRSQASKTGMISYELESRLALGEIKMKSAEIDAGRADLAVLKKDANALGYILLAHKAAALMVGLTPKKG